MCYVYVVRETGRSTPEEKPKTKPDQAKRKLKKKNEVYGHVSESV